MTAAPLAGQDTLLSCWRALAATEFGPGRLVDTPEAVAAVFPASAYFNNAILTGDGEVVAPAVAAVTSVYAAAGSTGWALWVPSTASTFDAAEGVIAGPPLVRDVTTLVMHRVLDEGFRDDPRVRRVSSASARLLALEDDVRPADLHDHEDGDPIVGWALVEQGEVAVSAYSHRHGRDCGIYAVETRPEWRRQGLARALVEHLLATEFRAGARTASLQSTPMAEPLYRAQGFRAAGRYEEWVFSPPAGAPSDDDRVTTP